MLTQTLRSLEDDGIANRKIYPVVPPTVEYSLTPLGRSLIEPLEAICRWAEEHLLSLRLPVSARNGRNGRDDRYKS
jgi:DNA-binding HxlR family transcriptional regulator